MNDSNETALPAIQKKTVRDIDVAGKTVLVRADLNAPLENGVVADDTRLLASMPTLTYLIGEGARVVLCSHLGRPKGTPVPEMSLQPVAARLGELLGVDVAFAHDCVGELAEQAVANLEDGGVLLLENLRFHAEEEANDAEFARQLAELADIYVNDAFGAAHRAHASTAGVAAYLPAVAGLLMQREVGYLSALVDDPPRPFAVIVGGAKVSTKTAAIDHLLSRLDMLVVGGGMANTFLAALGVDMGRSLVEEDQLPLAKAILDRAGETGIQVVLPVDMVVADELAADATASSVDVAEIPGEKMTLDIGPRTIELFCQKLSNARAIIWNGPMGVFELDQFSEGSFALARFLAESNAVTVAGGGETAAVIARTATGDRFSHVSTGGGASLELLEGQELPGVAALLDA